MNELDIIQKLDQIIADLTKEGLLDIANNLEIEKQKCDMYKFRQQLLQKAQF